MRTISTLLITVILISSCTAPRYAYSPASHNVPLLKQKGDSKIGLCYSSNITGNSTVNGVDQDQSTRGIDIHAAHAITDKFAFLASYFSRSERQSSEASVFLSEDSGSIDYKRNLVEFGVGYYKRLDEHDMIQVFAGMGKGKTKIRDVGRYGSIYLNRFLDADVTKIFIQPALIINSDKQFVFSLSSRFSYIHFGNIKSNYDSAQKVTFRLNDMYDKPSFFWEPAVVGSYAFSRLPGLRIESQIGSCSILNNSDISFRKINFSIGITSNLRELLR